MYGKIVVGRRVILDVASGLLYDTTMSRFQDLEVFTATDVDAAFGRNDTDELRLMSVSAALISPEPSFAQTICIKLFSSKDSKVRGNAVMSLGHLARRFRLLDETLVKPLIESALKDADDYVRVRAKSAADEIHQFLYWKIAGHVFG